MLSNVGLGLLVAAVLMRLVTESQGGENEGNGNSGKDGNDGVKRNMTYNGTSKYTAKPPAHSTSTSTSPRCAEWSSTATLALALGSILLQSF